MQHPQILQVVEDDLCIACGACVATCPKDNVSAHYVEPLGAHGVAVTDVSACIGCPAPCVDVCPSVVNRNLVPAGSPAVEVERLGPIKAVRVAHAPDEYNNGVSSSGGVVRAAARAFLTAGSPVVCLARSAEGYTASLLTEPDETERMPGSIYHSVSFVDAIPLLRRARRPCLLIAIPCVLAGIDAHIQTSEPELEDKIALRLGLICGWMFTDHALKAFLSAKGLPGPVLNAQYRGEDRVGRLKIDTPQGRVDFSRRQFDDAGQALDYRSSFSAAANRLRCRLCQDHVNVSADIAVGDAWLARTSDRKRSVAVLRTDAGEAFFDRLQSSGAVESEPGGPEDVLESQSEDLVFGTTARRLGAYLAEHGVSTVEYRFAEEPEIGSRRRWDEWVFSSEWRLRSLLREGRYQEFRRRYAWDKRLRVSLHWMRRLRSLVPESVRRDSAR